MDVFHRLRPNQITTPPFSFPAIGRKKLIVRSTADASPLPVGVLGSPLTKSLFSRLGANAGVR
jgi:hypothetical protein